MTEFIPALLGGFVGGVAAISVDFIKSRINYYTDRYNDLCKTIVDAADLSSQYWLLSVSSDESIPRNDAELGQFEKARDLEVRIEGLQEQILLGDEDLRSELPKENRQRINDILRDYLNSLTGGDYKARTGASSVVSASLVQVEAARLVSEIRSGLRAKYTIIHLVKILFRIH
jgi:hypothetical protein